MPTSSFFLKGLKKNTSNIENTKSTLLKIQNAKLNILQKNGQNTEGPFQNITQFLILNF